MSRPAIDVVISTSGGRPAMLAEAIDSVRAQIYDGVVATVIVYDTAAEPVDPVESSTDPARPVRWIRSRGSGLPAARNSGIAATAAEWVAFLDDDDLWLPAKLAAQIAAVEDGVPLVGCGVEIVDASAVRTPRPAPMLRLTRRDLLADRIMELHPSSFLIRRTALEQVGGIDEQIPGGYAEDYDLLLRVAVLGPILCVREPLVQIRWTGGSYFFSRWQTIASAIGYLLVKHPDFAQSRRGHARLLGQIAFAEAAMGHRRLAIGSAFAALRRSPTERRAPLAVAVALGLMSAERVQSALHRRGRGI